MKNKHFNLFYEIEQKRPSKEKKNVDENGSFHDDEDSGLDPIDTRDPSYNPAKLPLNFLLDFSISLSFSLHKCNLKLNFIQFHTKFNSTLYFSSRSDAS